MNDAIIGGMMMITGAASAVTGGAGAAGGETVVTGDSSASVQVSNVINADNDGGTSHTIIEKTVNGVKEVTEETKEFAPGEPVIVEVGVEANSQTTVDAEAEATTEEATSTSAESEQKPPNFRSYILEKITGFFASVWSWWST
ncbi:MAG: hypothetical protein U1C66_02590 [Patescibacteria group bacterium]|nr:hypothetical protein [Patescibacteria group bacterium]